MRSLPSDHVLLMILTQLVYGCGDSLCVHVKSFQCGGYVVYRVWPTRSSHMYK